MAKRPAKREGSSYEMFLKRIPKDVKKLLIGKKVVFPLGNNHEASITVTASTQAFRFSLRTTDVREGKARRAACLAFAEKIFADVLRGQPTDLDNQQLYALVRVLYVSWSRATNTDNSITVIRRGKVMVESHRGPEWDFEGYNGSEQNILDLSAEFVGTDTRPDARTGENPFDGLRILLLKHGIINITPQSERRALSVFRDFYAKAIKSSAELAGGNYGSDPILDGLPREMPAARRSVSLKGLVADWWAANERLGKSVSTHEKYVITFNHLRTMLGHDEATAVTNHDLRNFRDRRLLAVAPVTVRSDFIALNSVFSWAVDRRMLDHNPAEGISMPRMKQVKVRERDFTDAEAALILKHANGATGDTSVSTLAKYWVPWLCAYTGARVGECCQLRKEDIRQEKGVWVAKITPEAGSVKTSEYRDVPLHAHLIERGFIDFVKKAPGGYLFLQLKKDATFRQTWRGRKNRISEFVREVLKDPNVAPNHGWRHTFKSKGFEVDIQEKVLDAICGHAPTTVGRAYGSVSLKTKIDAIAKFPRYDVK